MHKNGTLHVKRYFDEKDFEEADQSPFVNRRWGPFEAYDVEQAWRILRVMVRLANLKINVITRFNDPGWEAPDESLGLWERK